MARFVWCGIAACLVAGGLSLFGPHLAPVRQWVIHGYVYVLWILVLWLAYSLWRNFRAMGPWRDTLKESLLPSILWGGIGAFLLSQAIPAEFRVLADETNLLGSALSLHWDRSYQNITEGVFYYDSLHPERMDLDNRPPLFPFLVALVHDLWGYDPRHGFAVNLLLAALILGITYGIGREMGGRRFGIWGALSFLSMPVFGLCVRSSGFETINMLFTLLLYVQTYRYLKSPSSDRLELLFLLVLAVSLCRYESIVLAFPALIAALWGLRSVRFSLGSYRMMLIPFGFVLPNWQKWLTSSVNAGDRPDGGVFSLSHVPGHLQGFLEFFFDPAKHGYPTSRWTVAMAVVSFVILGYRFASLSRLVRRTGLVIVIGTAGVMLAQAAHYLGDVRLAFQQRFAASYVPAIVLAVMAAWHHIEDLWGRPAWLRSFATGVSLVAAVAGLRLAQIAEQGHSLILYREYKLVLDFLLKEPRAGTLILTDRPGMYVVHGYGAKDAHEANQDIGAITHNMKRKLYTNVLLVQQVSYDAPRAPKPALTLPPGFGLATALEVQNAADHYLRISRITPPPAEWESMLDERVADEPHGHAPPWTAKSESSLDP